MVEFGLEDQRDSALLRQGREERAITWQSEKGFTHERIDEGEESPAEEFVPDPGPNGVCPVQDVLTLIRSASGQIDPAIRSFVEAKISEYQPGKVYPFHKYEGN